MCVYVVCDLRTPRWASIANGLHLLMDPFPHALAYSFFPYYLFASIDFTNQNPLIMSTSRSDVHVCVCVVCIYIYWVASAKHTKVIRKFMDHCLLCARVYITLTYYVHLLCCTIVQVLCVWYISLISPFFHIYNVHYVHIDGMGCVVLCILKNSWCYFVASCNIWFPFCARMNMSSTSL